MRNAFHTKFFRPRGAIQFAVGWAPVASSGNFLSTTPAEGARDGHLSVIHGLSSTEDIGLALLTQFLADVIR